MRSFVSCRIALCHTASGVDTVSEQVKTLINRIKMFNRSWKKPHKWILKSRTNVKWAKMDPSVSLETSCTELLCLYYTSFTLFFIYKEQTGVITVKTLPTWVWPRNTALYGLTGFSAFIFSVDANTEWVIGQLMPLNTSGWKTLSKNAGNGNQNGIGLTGCGKRGN